MLRVIYRKPYGVWHLDVAWLDIATKRQIAICTSSVLLRTVWCVTSISPSKTTHGYIQSLSWTGKLYIGQFDKKHISFIWIILLTSNRHPWTLVSAKIYTDDSTLNDDYFLFFCLQIMTYILGVTITTELLISLTTKTRLLPREFEIPSVWVCIFETTWLGLWINVTTKIMHIWTHIIS